MTPRAHPALSRGERRRRPRRKQRGIAFVLVLGALTILTVMLTELQDQSSAEFGSALSSRDALVAEYAAKSALNLSRLLIASEPTIRNALGPILAMMMRGERPQIPVWEFSDQVLGAFNDSSGTEAFASFSGLDMRQGKNLGLGNGASFEVKIVDEDAKINVNLAARNNDFLQQLLVQQLSALTFGPQYDPLFESRDADGNFSDRQAICSALIDWADSKQDTTLCDPTVTTAQEMPAEDSYYELLPRPYSRKNAGFDSLQELRRVRGMGDDFWATFVDPDPERPDKRVVTVWGASQGININTAAPQTLLALVCSLAVPNTRLCIDPLEMQKFLTVVTMARGFTAGAPAFSSPKAFINALQGKGMLGPLLTAAGLEPVVLASPSQAMDRMTTESKVFSIYATGRVKSGKRETRLQLHAVVDYRGAPPPPEAPVLDPNGTQTPANPPANPDPNATTPTDPDSAGLTRALAPSPAGNVVYFRIN